MSKLENIKSKIQAIYSDKSASFGQNRRAAVIKAMRENESQGLNCESCQGYCCTYQYNSMMINPVEAFEILIDLNNMNRLDFDLIGLLKKNAREFRLDKEVWQKNTLLRRYYTCPFYMDQKLGCSLSVKLKPLGCLAFNSMKQGVSEPGFCETDETPLKKQEEINLREQIQIQKEIKEAFDITWDKKPIATALLDFLV